MTHFKDILFVVEDKIDLNTFEHAVKLAKSQRAKLTFIDALEKPAMWAATQDTQKAWDLKFKNLLTHRQAVIEGAVKPHIGDIEISINVVEGKIYLEAIRSVLTNSHDLVIKNADVSKNVLSRIFGSQDMRLLKSCPCPVLITKPIWDGKFKHVMAAVDFENPNDIDEDNVGNLLNRQIMETAITLSSRYKSRLDVVHVFPILGVGAPPDGRYGLQETETATYIKNRKPGYIKLIDRFIEKAKLWVEKDLSSSVEIEPYVLSGNPNVEIKKQAKKLQSDLVVMGTVARTGVSGFLIGNTAELILENIECSVLALKPEGFVSPVKL